MCDWVTIGIATAGVAGLAARFHFWRPNLPGVPVLMYHYLGDDLTGVKLPKLWVKPAAFRRQMDYLANNGYRTISVEQLLGRLAHGDALPEKPVLITFDDGEKSSLALAREIMAPKGFTGMVFTPTDLAGKTNEWDRDKGERQVDLAAWDELKALAGAGWDIASHTRTHSELPTLSDSELADELAGSKEKLQQEFGKECFALAYPYGAHDDRVRKAAREAGYRLGFSIRHGKNTDSDDPLALKRLIVKRKDWLTDFSLKLRKGRSSF